MDKLDQIPPPAPVAAELKQWGARQDDRYSPGLVVLPDETLISWQAALTRMRRQAQAFQALANTQMKPWWRSSTALMLLGGLVTLATIAVTFIQDPVVAAFIPAPYNALLGPAIASIGVPAMLKWWNEHRAEQERAVSEERRAFALALASGIDHTPPGLPRVSQD